jgi:hypothetical protein
MESEEVDPGRLTDEELLARIRSAYGLPDDWMPPEEESLSKAERKRLEQSLRIALRFQESERA